jgi:hypothetical protein
MVALVQVIKWDEGTKTVQLFNRKHPKIAKPLIILIYLVKLKTVFLLIV